MRAAERPYPPIQDYALVGDCHSVALVSRCGSIDWCCMPRIDSPSCFGRLLDWAQGGHFLIAPTAAEWDGDRRYVDHTLVLETRFRTAAGEARLLDAFAMRRGGRELPFQQLLRVVEGVAGTLELRIELQPRFEYGAVKPWTRQHGEGVFTLLGGAGGLVVCTDLPLAESDENGLFGRVTVRPGERRRLSMLWEEPNRLHPGEPPTLPLAAIDERLSGTLEWWQRWAASRSAQGGHPDPQVLRSAVVVKGLINAPSGAIAAAATTSLPESLDGGERNWDYRLSWIRDSSFALESLGALGFHQEAGRFTHFIQRATAGFPDEVQPMYGLDGRHLVPELALHHLEGYRGARPVRVGNAASHQLQLDAMGELLDLAWRAVRRGDEPGPDYRRFLAGVVESVIAHWREPDFGIWEFRREPLHFVHSKVMCWAAIDRGIRLALHAGLDLPVERWRAARDEIRRAVERDGYDRERGVFVQAFGNREPDASLLLLPRAGFVGYDDPRMVRTAELVGRELREGEGLVRRYRTDDGLEGREGCFVACSFWLAQCLALQGDRERAEPLFAAACALANDVGLFSEEHDGKRMLGNFPQGLSHYSHIGAAVALARGGEAGAEEGQASAAGEAG